MITQASIKTVYDPSVEIGRKIIESLVPPPETYGALFLWAQYEAEGELVFWTIALGDVAQ